MLSIFRALTSVHQLVVFEVYSRISFSYEMIKRLFGYSTNTRRMRMDRGTSLRGRRFMIVGLGNFPHPDTRHSVGMRALDNFIDRHELTWKSVQGRKGGLLSKTELSFHSDEADNEGKMTEIFMFKPKSLMNICGGNVAKAAKLLGVMSDSIYLIHDELDIGLGKFSIKNGGSANGHRGVLSCVAELKSTGLWPKEVDTDGIILPRLRIGIGRPTSKSLVVPYVLDSFPQNDVQVIESAIDRGMNLMLRHIQDRVKRQRRAKTEHNGERTDVT